MPEPALPALRVTHASVPAEAHALGKQVLGSVDRARADFETSSENDMPMRSTAHSATTISTRLMTT
jgi:hypothetical protein